MRIPKKNKIIEKIFSEKTRDYTFAILFFLIFSVFIFFAIRPSLTTAFSLQKEEKDLRGVNDVYEKRIIDVARIQSQLEENRDKLYLIDSAIPEAPQVSKIIDDLNKIDQNGSFFIKKASIGEVNLSKNAGKEGLKTIRITIESESDFKDALTFINETLSQRRLKTIQRILFQRIGEGSDSAKLKIGFDIEGYHL
jgi:Tfp pilus assembly protein PilO